MLKKNEIYRAVVTGFTSEGLGVCRVEGCAVFVPSRARNTSFASSTSGKTPHTAGSRRL